LKSLAKVQQIPLRHDVAVQNKQAETMVRAPVHIIYILSYLACIYIYIYTYIYAHMHIYAHTHKYTYVHKHTQMVGCGYVFLVWDFMYMDLIPS